MTKKTAQLTIATIATSLMASLAPVPAKSISLNTVTSVEKQATQEKMKALAFELPHGQIFLPLDEASEYLNNINIQQRILLDSLKEKRKNRGKGPLFTNVAQVKRLCIDGLERHTQIKSAVQQVMSGNNIYNLFPDDLEQQAKYKKSLLQFGFAVAQGEFILRDILSCIEQCSIPEKTVRLVDMPDQKEVSAWIIAEHSKVGVVDME
ncbi:TPA: iron-sulfur cluster assembly scaffold protein SufA [Proteus mirabilis]|uniref:iron-sulfur cluster assembly scaffold protein SufA n=1 Tax=Proteus mirabilis TaxID=584 RepID=UPI0013D20415|nr:iron-sulfur cluster assembly scaffold protein SufA [Proteus mirabilis]MBG2847580.1 iron-sulfur cluster assembly scaffold protein SufA [Proteus mirabilis]MBG3122092.1 iron-sulfur cluster assembly scaffold protein SufA [Proteus mirabilis]MBI6230953.1 iron-sulfur cluster assembly scaffold protein SufA [Proteus mirabilis]MBI6292418.1 iron-sulfur cluster assembly scaffold protein SufA [Proteus mirabilis]MBI6323667.1 iron-sulfur cluster assembly scaffold protein SufA [Proteus mirabilis]